ncbi:hypothetical protein BaRGS_00029419 [Batillaria attramentaria]|uniref:Uncharacterized protein n=1 Tax=Batillaria attramentaria TaxID=370345 RepID=A0ABD0JXM3_9CAEN
MLADLASLLPLLLRYTAALLLVSAAGEPLPLPEVRGFLTNSSWRAGLAYRSLKKKSSIRNTEAERIPLSASGDLTALFMGFLSSSSFPANPRFPVKAWKRLYYLLPEDKCCPTARSRTAKKMAPSPGKPFERNAFEFGFTARGGGSGRRGRAGKRIREGMLEK